MKNDFMLMWLIAFTAPFGLAACDSLPRAKTVSFEFNFTVTDGFVQKTSQCYIDLKFAYDPSVLPDYPNDWKYDIFGNGCRIFVEDSDSIVMTLDGSSKYNLLDIMVGIYTGSFERHNSVNATDPDSRINVDNAEALDFNKHDIPRFAWPKAVFLTHAPVSVYMLPLENVRWTVSSITIRRVSPDPGRTAVDNFSDIDIFFNRPLLGGSPGSFITKGSFYKVTVQ
jgi:hypothetical protein